MSTAPTTLVALDPGSRRAGLAVFDAGLGIPLRAIDLLTNRASVASMVDEITIATAGLDPSSAVLLAEWPRRYANQRAAWRDIDDLRAVVSTVEAWGWVRTVRVSPFGWKGNVPKSICHARTAEALTDETRRAIRWDYLGPDARDAVSLGRWGFGAGRRRTFPQEAT